MAASKKNKQVRQVESPKGKVIAQGGDPEQYYSEKPAWVFASADKEKWAVTEEHIGSLIWSEILPKLQEWETQTWSEILLKAKDKNHSIDVSTLNKVARERLVERRIEGESIISLRMQGKHRLYGYMLGRVFCILWFDDDHGDNDTCVCRSNRKHT